MATLYNYDISTFTDVSFFSDKGSANFAAARYSDAFESMSKMGDIMQGILTSSSTGNVATITQVFSDFLENVRSMVVEPLKVVGIALALMFVIIAIFQLAMEDRMNPEIFVKHFAKFGLAMIAITYSDTLIDYIMQFGNALGNWAGGLSLGGGATGTIPSKLDMCNVFYSGLEAGLCEQWGLFFDAILNGAIVGIVALVMEAVAYLIAFSRMIELSVRAAGMPIAMGMLADDGWKGTGGRYIKKFVAICSQSFVLIMIAKVTTGIMATSMCSVLTSMQSIVLSGSGKLLSTMMGGIVISLGVGFSSVTIMFKSIGLINDMFGA